MPKTRLDIYLYWLYNPLHMDNTIISQIESRIAELATEERQLENRLMEVRARRRELMALRGPGAVAPQIAQPNGSATPTLRRLVDEEIMKLVNFRFMELVHAVQCRRPGTSAQSVSVNLQEAVGRRTVIKIERGLYKANIREDA